MTTREDSLPWLTSLTVGAGITLLPLMPIGLVLGTTHPSFVLLSWLSIGLFAAAGVLSATLPLLLSRESVLGGLGVVLAVLGFIAFSAIFSAAPPVAKDALTHHLAVPLWWAEAQKILPIRWHEWSHYPMLFQTAFILPLSMGAEWIPTALHALMAIILAGIVASYLWKTRGAEAALLGYSLILTTPVILKLSSEPLVDLALAVFITVAVVRVALWLTDDKARGNTLIAAIALGIAFGIKYNAMLAAFAIVVFSFIVGCRKSPARAARCACILAVTSALLFLPWALKNILWVGNPVYPLLKGTFGPFDSIPGPAMLKPLEHRALIYHESWWEIALLPLRILVWGEDGNPRLFDGLLSPLFLVGVGLFILRGRKDRAVAFLGLSALAYICLAVFLGSARVRYLSPVYGSLCILSVIGLTELWQRRWMRPFVSLLVLCHLGLGAWYGWTYLARSRVLEFTLGKLTRDEYLTYSIPEYELIAFANREIPHTSHVYLLYTSNPFYYLNPRSFSGGYVSAAPLLRWIKSSRDGAGLARELNARGIDYFLTHTERLREDMYVQLSKEADTAKWNDFQRDHLLHVANARGFSLWRIQ